MRAIEARYSGVAKSQGPYRECRLNKSTHALISISYEHHEIHDGNSYFVFGNATLNTNNTLSVAITTPDTTEEQHIIIDVRVTDAATFAWISGVTSYTGGNAYTPINRNTRSSNTSNVVCKRGWTGNNPLVLTGGTTKYTEIANSSKGVIWDRQSGEEIVLPRNSIEVFRATSLANGNTMNILINWYEHTPKN